MNFINGDYENSIFAIAFSSKKNLLDYLNGNELDVLLISEEALKDEDIGNNTSGLNIVRLAEEQKSQNEQGYVYKYSKGEVIQNEIIRAYKMTETDIKSGIYKTFAVISPIGRSGKTELSKAICCLDEVRGGIYVGMEVYGELEETESNLHGMSEMAYLIKIRSEDISEYLDEYVIPENDFSKLVSPKSYFDIRDLDKDDIKWFIDALIKWGKYTSIVFDMDGASLSDISILALFDEVIVPVLKDTVSENKLKSFKELLNMQELGKVVGRLREVEVPNVPYNSTEMIRCAGRLVEN